MVVVIGTGLGGLAISCELSRHGIPHLLLGRPESNRRPRLGESLDPPGVLGMRLVFPELSDCWFPKTHASVLIADYAGLLCVDARAYASETSYYRGYGLEPFALLHVDRAELDARAHRRAVAHPCCTWIDEPVTAIRTDASSARIRRIEFGDDQHVEPTFVFDASGLQQSIIRHLELPKTFLGEPEHAAFTHLTAETAPAGTELPGWMHATNLLRLQKAHDGIDGVAWAIPLGRHLSIGVSAGDDGGPHDDAALIEATIDAYERRGIALRTWYPDRLPSTAIVGANYRHFETQLSSDNWLLVGFAGMQTWFTMSSGVGASLFVARIAPRLLQEPRKWMRAYDKYMAAVRRSHRHHQRGFAHENVPTRAEAMDVMRNVVEAGIDRLDLGLEAMCDQRPPRIRKWLDTALYEALKRLTPLIEKEIRFIIEENRAAQAERLFDAEAFCKVVR